MELTVQYHTGGMDGWFLFPSATPSLTSRRDDGDGDDDDDDERLIDDEQMELVEVCLCRCDSFLHVFSSPVVSAASSFVSSYSRSFLQNRRHESESVRGFFRRRRRRTD